MIGIITYISVLERTKEIGILRSIGASKKDISRVFNAETFIIGLLAGLLGVGLTVLLDIPVNIIIEHVSGVKDMAAVPAGAGAALVAISVLLTLIGGIIPSRMAAKKDPVTALRTE
jgi:putative ABC transport system permease protein